MNGGMIGMIAIYAVIIGLVYLFLLRPNSKKKKEEAAMRYRRQSCCHQG